MTTETPRIEVTIAAPVAEVWRALRERDRIRHWHGWDSDGLVDEINLIYFGEPTEGIPAEVVEAAQPVEDADVHALEVQQGDRFVLEPDGEGTRVTLTRAPRGVSEHWDAYYDDITEGWTTFLHQLKFFLERQPDAERRTLFFFGVAGDAEPVVEELGLAEVAGHPVGTPYAVRLVDEDVKGEVWFRSEHQFGVTVDAWGDGLLVVAYTPPSEAKPQGVAMAVLSTYGLDSTRFDDLNARWSAWWSARYPAPAV